MKTEIIGDTNVQVMDGQSVIYFTGGHSDGRPVEFEMGNYCFWTLCGEDEYGEWMSIARGREELPASDRFQRMDTERLMAKLGLDRIEYQTVWDRIPTAKLIRPSSLREITRWFETHESDVAYASAFVTMNGVRQLIPRRII